LSTVRLNVVAYPFLCLHRLRWHTYMLIFKKHILSMASSIVNCDNFNYYVKTENLVLKVDMHGQTVRQYFENRLLNVCEENIRLEIHSILKSDGILQIAMFADENYSDTIVGKGFCTFFLWLLARIS